MPGAAAAALAARGCSGQHACRTSELSQGGGGVQRRLAAARGTGRESGASRLFSASRLSLKRGLVHVLKPTPRPLRANKRGARQVGWTGVAYVMAGPPAPGPFRFPSGLSLGRRAMTGFASVSSCVLAIPKSRHLRFKCSDPLRVVVPPERRKKEGSFLRWVPDSASLN